MPQHSLLHLTNTDRLRPNADLYRPAPDRRNPAARCSRSDTARRLTCSAAPRQVLSAALRQILRQAFILGLSTASGLIALSDGAVAATPRFRPICETIPLPPELAENALQARNCSLLMIGDSLMEDFSLQLCREINQRKGLDIRVVTRRASLLHRPGRFRLAERLGAELDRAPADILVVMLGSEETMPLHADGEDHPIGSPAWEQACGRRILEILDTAAAHQTEVIWVGLPATAGKHAESLSRLSTLARDIVRSRGCLYIDNSRLLAAPDGSGAYTEESPDGHTLRLRQRDGTHLTREGNRRLVEHFLPVLEQRIRHLLTLHPERIVLPGQSDTVAPLRFRMRTF